MSSARMGLVSRDSNSIVVCQYKQGPLTLRAICPIQSDDGPIQFSGAAERAKKRREAQAKTAQHHTTRRRLRRRRRKRRRGVFTFNYGSKRVLTGVDDVSRSARQTTGIVQLGRNGMQFLLFQNFNRRRSHSQAK